MELLDNLPHDKLTVCKENGSILQAELHPENCVEKERACNTIHSPASHVGQGDGHQPQEYPQWRETFQPLTDEILQRLIETYPPYKPNVETLKPKWVPTVASQVITQINFHT